MPNERIRILHCLAAVATGGVERRRLILARRLDPLRYEQRVLTREIQGTIASQLEEAGVSVRLVGTRMHRLIDPKAFSGAIRTAISFRPHIVHGAVFEALPMAVLAGRACGARIVLEETSYATSRTWRGHSLFRALVGLSDACVAISEPVATYLQDRTRIPKAKITVIRNGVSVPDFPSLEQRGSIRATLGIPNDAFVVGTVGRLIAAKRIVDLLSALSIVAQHDQAAWLLVIGDGRERDNLAEAARRLGVSERVVFAGHRDDVGTMLRAMDVFTLASEHEGFGLVLAEAMMCELPIVATAVGGIPTVVSDNETGILVPPLAPAAIADAIRRLRDQPELRRQMGLAGRLRAEGHFGAERYARDLDAFYSQLLAH